MTKCIFGVCNDSSPAAQEAVGHLLSQESGAPGEDKKGKAADDEAEQPVAEVGKEERGCS